MSRTVSAKYGISPLTASPQSPSSDADLVRFINNFKYNHHVTVNCSFKQNSWLCGPCFFFFKVKKKTFILRVHKLLNWKIHVFLVYDFIMLVLSNCNVTYFNLLTTAASNGVYYNSQMQIFAEIPLTNSVNAFLWTNYKIWWRHICLFLRMRTNINADLR